MILNFTVKNFLSFGKEQTFSMIASNKIHDHPNQVSQITDSISALNTAVVYGANASGKSNFTEAFEFLQRLTSNKDIDVKHTGWIGCAFTPEEKTGEIEITFFLNNQIMTYGVIVDQRQIIEEWLLVGTDSNEKTIFERTTNSKGKVTVELHEGVEDKTIQAAATISQHAHLSFFSPLKGLFEDSNESDESVESNISFEDTCILTSLYWFGVNLEIIAPTSQYLAMSHILAERKEFRHFASTFLKSTSTGVDSIEVDEDPIPKDVADKIISTFGLQEYPREDYTLFLNPERTDTTQVVKRDDKYFTKDIYTMHGEHKFNIMSESDGTKRLLHLLWAMYTAISKGGVYIIDEIDRSLHPHLTREFIKFFIKNKKNEGQLIITTHESNLLDSTILRRDSIWFTEKGFSGETNLYSLSSFKPRNDLDLQKNYLQGRFGAIPFFGSLNFDDLLTNVDTNE